MSPWTFALEIPSMVLEVAAKGALIALAALGAAVALRRASAASRHLVLALTTAALLLLPLLAAIVPSREIAVLPAVSKEPVAITARGPVEELPGPYLETESPRIQTAAPTPVAAAPAKRSLPVTLPAAAIFGLLALTVSGLLVARLLFAVRRLAGLAAGSVPASPEWLRLLDQQRERLGIAHAVRLGISVAVAVPVTFGWRRPVVLMPEAARGWDDEQLREALVHELAHVRRRDWPWQLAARFASAVHWFNPLVWLLSRRLRLEAELACDDQVLRAGAGAAVYAERLVALARVVRNAARHPSMATAIARPSGLASRVTALLDAKRRRGGPGRFAVAGASAAALIVLLGVAPARLVRAAMQEHPGDRPRTPLGVAAWEGDLDEVQRLLAAGAPVDLAPKGDATPLMYAAERGHPEVVEALLDAGADPNAMIVGDGTPLIAAARGGDARIVRRLLALGANPNVYVTGDETALRQAIENGHAEAARELLGAWAAPLTEEARRRAVEGGVRGGVWGGVEGGVHGGVEGGVQGGVEGGVQGGVQGGVLDGISDGIEQGRQEALIEAAEHGDLEAVRFLLDKGADPNGAVLGDGSPLIAAARKGSQEIVELLLKKGAHPDRAVRGDGSPLIAAAAAGRAAVVRQLLAAGASIDLVVPDDENPLIQAAANGRLEVVRILLDAGADPNIRVVADRFPDHPEGDLRTPLRMARRGGHEAVVRLLLERGARD